MSTAATPSSAQPGVRGRRPPPRLATEPTGDASTEEAAEEDGARREKEARAELLQAWLERRLLGNRIAVLVSTGAPLRHEVQRWLTRVFGRLVLNGYGATETGGITSNGIVSDGVDIRLRDLPTLGYRTSDTPFPRGEILARSDATYFHRERFDAGRGTVAAALYGHDHDGGYTTDDHGIHHATFQAILETPDDAYATLRCYDDRIEVHGVGTVPSAVWKLPTRE